MKKSFYCKVEYDSIGNDVGIILEDVSKCLSEEYDITLSICPLLTDEEIENLECQNTPINYNKTPRSEISNILLNEDICKPAEISNIASFMIDQLQLLNSQGQNIVIIDKYLFYPGGNDINTYIKDLESILESLQSTNLLVYANSISRDAQLIESTVTNDLINKNIRITVDNAALDYHDRFWINKDKREGVVFGTSLNSMTTNLFYYDVLSKADVNEILKFFGIQ